MGNFTLQDAIALATFAHRNQFDKAGMPYIEHPLRVMASVQAQGAMPYVQMAAVLHDVTEDTPFTPEMLLAFSVPESAVDLVKLLDRDYSKKKLSVQQDAMLTADICVDANTYYYAQIQKNPFARMIKLADIHDNTQEWRMVYLPQATQDRLKIKYEKARNQLL